MCSCLAKFHRDCERAGDWAAASRLGTDEDAVLQVAVVGRASEEGRGCRDRDASAIKCVTHGLETFILLQTTLSQHVFAQYVV